jgi:hypothetical protein
MTQSRFERFAITGLVERPEWWLVRPDEIEAAVQGTRKAQVQSIARTPNGYDVWAVAYGPPRPEPGTATWASGSASRNVGCYKTGPANAQAVVILCCVHGAEPESTCSAVNLLTLLETGKDLRGKARPALVELAGCYRLLILPCVNVDGRAVSPDHLRGASPEQFVRASQGVWADGTPIGYPRCKEHAPLPLDRVQHPGGYPNGDGYNIQHDVAPGDIRTAEARGVLRLVAEEQADLILNMHSHGVGGRVLGASMLAYPLHVERVRAYQQRVRDALDAAGLRPADVLPLESRGGLSLTAACAWASGGLAITFEHPAVQEWTFDEMLETFYVTVETCLRWGLEEPFSPRELVKSGKTE